MRNDSQERRSARPKILEFHYQVLETRMVLAVGQASFSDLPNLSGSEGYRIFVQARESVVLQQQFNTLRDQVYEVSFDYSLASSASVGALMNLHASEPVSGIRIQTYWNDLSLGDFLVSEAESTARIFTRPGSETISILTITTMDSLTESNISHARVVIDNLQVVPCSDLGIAGFGEGPIAASSYKNDPTNSKGPGTDGSEASNSKSREPVNDISQLQPISLIAGAERANVNNKLDVDVRKNQYFQTSFSNVSSNEYRRTGLANGMLDRFQANRVMDYSTEPFAMTFKTSFAETLELKVIDSNLAFGSSATSVAVFDSTLNSVGRLNERETATSPHWVLPQSQLPDSASRQDDLVLEHSNRSCPDFVGQILRKMDLLDEPDSTFNLNPIRKNFTAVCWSPRLDRPAEGSVDQTESTESIDVTVPARDETKAWSQTLNEQRLIAISTVGCYALSGLWRRKPDDSNDRFG